MPEGHTIHRLAREHNRLLVGHPVPRPARRAGSPTVPSASRAHCVYRRAGLPCRVCGTEVRTEVMVGRNLFWCPTGQR